MQNLFEATLSMRERKGLPEEMYGLPNDKKFPIDTKKNLIRAIEFFKVCPDAKKQILANNINRRCRELNVVPELDEDSPFLPYYVAPTKESAAQDAERIDIKDNIFKQLDIKAKNEDVLVTINEIRVSALSKSGSDDYAVIEGAIKEYLKGIYILTKYNIDDVAQLKIEAMGKAYTVVYSTAKRIIECNVEKIESTAITDLKELLFEIFTTLDSGYMTLIMRLLFLAPEYYKFQYSEEDMEEINGMYKYATSVSDAQMSVFDYEARAFDKYLNRIKYPLYYLEVDLLAKESNFKSTSQEYIIPVAEAHVDSEGMKLIVDGDELNSLTQQEMIVLQSLCKDYTEISNTLKAQGFKFSSIGFNGVIPPKKLTVHRIEGIGNTVEEDITLLEPSDGSQCIILLFPIDDKKGELCKLMCNADSEERKISAEFMPIDTNKLDLDSESLFEAATRGINIEPDGSIRFTIRPDKTYMDEYAECHRLLVTNYNNKNYTGVKDNLCFMFTLIATIERDVMYADNDKKVRKAKMNSPEYKDALDARALAINDFKTYMAKMQKVDKDFDFVKYYQESNYGKIVYRITPDAIKGIKRLLQLIIAG